MGIFRKKTTEGPVTLGLGLSATAVLEPSEMDGFRRQIEPLQVELAGLRKRLDQEKKRQTELKAAYDAACMERVDTPDIDLGRIKDQYEDISGLIAGIEKTIQRKEAELRPIEARYY